MYQSIFVMIIILLFFSFSKMEFMAFQPFVFRPCFQSEFVLRPQRDSLAYQETKEGCASSKTKESKNCFNSFKIFKTLLLFYCHFIHRTVKAVTEDTGILQHSIQRITNQPLISPNSSLIRIALMTWGQPQPCTVPCRPED